MQSTEARVAELADARDSKSRGPLGRVGSTPTSGKAKRVPQRDPLVARNPSTDRSMGEPNAETPKDRSSCVVQAGLSLFEGEAWDAFERRTGTLR